MSVNAETKEVLRRVLRAYLLEAMRAPKQSHAIAPYDVDKTAIELRDRVVLLVAPKGVKA